MSRTLHVPAPVKLVALGHLGVGALWGLMAVVCAWTALTGGSQGGFFAFSAWDGAWLALVAGGIGAGLFAVGAGLWAGARPARAVAIVLSALAALTALSGGAWLWGLLHVAVASYLAMSQEVARAFR